MSTPFPAKLPLILLVKNPKVNSKELKDKMSKDFSLLIVCKYKKRINENYQKIKSNNI